MEQGLAQQSAQQGLGMGGQGNPEQRVEEVVQMLMQGADPEELLQQGVPMEIIKTAIELIMAQEQQQATTRSVPATDSGLAMTAARKE